MRKLLWLVLAGSLSLAAFGESPFPQKFTFTGPWHTTSGLAADMTCVVTWIDHGKWQGHFYGIWEGAPYEYTVNFTGTPQKLVGTARINGAKYQWEGNMDMGAFTAQYGGNRYSGGFTLYRKPSELKVDLARLAQREAAKKAAETSGQKSEQKPAVVKATPAPAVKTQTKQSTSSGYTQHEGYYWRQVSGNQWQYWDGWDWIDFKANK